MLISFNHKGLKLMFERGDVSKVRADHVGKLRRILARLHSASELKDAKTPGDGFHPLIGDLQGHFAVKVSGNWRVTFRMENGDVYDVDYDDYH